MRSVTFAAFASFVVKWFPFASTLHRMIRRTAICWLLCIATVDAAAQSSPMRVFTGATLIDGTGRAPIPNATIVVANGRIVAAGPADSITIPGSERIPLDGKVVIPGLISAHVHVNDPRDLRKYAFYGITTVF